MEAQMKLGAIGIAAASIVAAGMTITSAQQTPASIDGLLSAAKVAAGTDWSGTFTRLCIAPPAGSARGGGPARGASAGGTAPAAATS